MSGVHPDPQNPPAGTIDPEVAEDYAEEVGVDPTSEEIDRYLQLEGEAPLGEERDLPSSP